MNIFFDMDYTLLGLDNSLRPGAREVLQRLKDEGDDIYIWSGMGLRWEEVKMFALEPLITDCFVKPLENFAAHVDNALDEEKLPVRPDLVIDDHREVPAALGGIWARPYLFLNDTDDEMERIYSIISEYKLTGSSKDSRFEAKAVEN